MKKAEQTERLKEMRRLYEVDKRSLQEVADCFGVTRQAVYERLAKAGVSFRQRNPAKRTLGREIIIQLYINENLTVLETAKRLKTYTRKVSEEIKKHEIKKQRRVYPSYKYTELNQLGIGEKVVIARPSIKKPHLGLYDKASRIGIRISIKSVNEETFQVSRIA